MLARAPIAIERLAAHHKRTNFDCGERALNDFLQRQAGQLERRGFGKTYVALAEDGVHVVTLSPSVRDKSRRSSCPRNSNCLAILRLFYALVG